MHNKKNIFILYLFNIFAVITAASSNQFDETVSNLYLGQDEGIDCVGLRIHLGNNNDLIYSNLLWHYRMGIRHFEIIGDVTHEQSQLISKFHNRVEDICSLRTHTEQSPDFLSTKLWVLELTDRQFLCLKKPLTEILSENESSTLVFPACRYSGFNPDVPISSWPQTDEQLIYRSPIDYQHPVNLLNKISPSVTQTSSAAHIAEFSTMEDAVLFTSDMERDQLPFMEVIKQSIQHACLRGKEYQLAEYFSFDIPSLSSPAAKIAEFINQYGANNNIRFSPNYIYVPTPKCAWSSISLALGSYEAGRRINFPAYKEFSKIINAEKYCEDLADERFYKMTCIRHPYDRMLSSFLDKIQPTGKNYFRENLGFAEDETVSYAEFLRRVKAKPIKELDEHFKPMWVLTMHPVIRYNKTIRLDEFYQDWAEVMQHIGIHGTPSDYDGTWHATHASSKREYLTEECATLLEKLCEEDLKIFGYPKIPAFKSYKEVMVNL